MFKYSKILNQETKEVSIANSGTQWVIYQGYTEQEVEQSDKDGRWYLKGYAPMKTEEEKAQEEAERRMREIKTELYELDLQAIRPLRAILAGTQTEEDLEKIKEIETMAKELRIKIQPLKSL